MKSLLQTLVRASLVAGLSLMATFNASAQDDSPGIVRISKPRTSEVRSPREIAQTGYVQESGSANCDCQFGGHMHGGCQHGCNGCCSGNGRAMAEYFRCKFGYFIPTGAGGAGVPFAGKYSRVYPQDPYYFDQRDGQAWGAQGYGIPMAVPLAPTVGHAYNYGWGSPSSRLTPISRPAY